MRQEYKKFYDECYDKKIKKWYQYEQVEIQYEDSETDTEAEFEQIIEKNIFDYEKLNKDKISKVEQIIEKNIFDYEKLNKDKISKVENNIQINDDDDYEKLNKDKISKVENNIQINEDEDLGFEEMIFFRQLVEQYTEQGQQETGLICGGKSKKQQNKGRQAGSNNVLGRIEKKNNLIIKDTKGFLQKLKQQYPQNVEIISMINGGRFHVEVNKSFQLQIVNLASNMHFETLEENKNAVDRKLKNKNNWEGFKIRKRKLVERFAQIYDFSNVQNILSSFKMTIQALNEDDQISTYLMEGQTIADVIKELLKFLRRYNQEFLEFPVDVREKHDETLARRKQEISTIQANFVITPQLIRGSKINGEKIMKEYKNYIIISPFTQKQCVAQCIAISEIYKEKEICYINMYVRIQKLQEKIAKENNIKDGVEIENLKEILQKYDIQLISDLNTEVEEKNQYCFVMDGHCLLILKKDSKSEYIFESIKQKHKVYQKVMKKYKPTKQQLERQIGLLTYDFEWITDKTIRESIQQYEYAWGLYTLDVGYVSNIQDRDNLDNLIQDFQQTFVDNLIDVVSKMSEDEIVVCGHNSMKCDLPRVIKTIVNDKRFTKTEESCQSGSAQISHPFNIPHLKKKIIFTDFINLQQTSLERVLKRFKCKLQKGKVMHNDITVENVKEQVIAQNINQYLQSDVEGLFYAYQAYRLQVQQSTSYFQRNKKDKKGKPEYVQGLDILKLKIFTSPSLAIKIFLSKFYDEDINPIFNPSDECQEFCRLSYHGGLSNNFRQGLFEYIRSLDINSSYAYQMIKELLPSGPQYFQLFNTQYLGGPLKYGIYEVVVQYTPQNLKYPCICVEEEGKLLTPILTDKIVYITHENLEKAFDQGYKLYIIRACLCDVVSNPFHDFITEIYAKRMGVKKLLKGIEDKIAQFDGIELTSEQEEILQNLWSEYFDLDAEQELLKLQLNSVYGKFCWWLEHKVSNQLTSNKCFLLQELSKGNITDIVGINDNYVMYSGSQKSTMKNSNFMIGSYITSRGRLQLIDMLEKLDQIKSIQTVYTDTDSVYFNMLPGFDQEKYNQIILPLCDSERLGAWKIEKNDQKGVFICSKNYGLQDKKNPQKELIKGKGIARYLIDPKAFERRLYEGQEQIIDFNWLVDLYNSKGQGKQFTKMQQFVQRGLLKDSSYDTIVVMKQVNTTIKGIISKSIVSNQGVCIPRRVMGDVKIQYETNKYETLRFPNFEQIQNYFKMKIEDVFDKYCTVQIEATREYIVIIDQNKIQSVIQEYGINKLHQMFGSFIIPVVDIDCKKQDYHGSDFKFMVSLLCQQVCQVLDIPLEQIKINDRSRDDKYSYHLYVPNKIINRQAFSARMQNLQLKETEYVSYEGYPAIDYSPKYIKYREREPTAAYHLDTRIYRQNGSLRISAEDMFYQPNFPQIQIETEQCLSELKQKQIRREELKMSKQQVSPIKEQVMQFLYDENIKGWSFNEAKIIKGTTVCYFKRGKDSEKYCKFCKRNHDHQDSLKVTVKGTTQQTMELGCTKYQKKIIH